MVTEMCKNTGLHR